MRFASGMKALGDYVHAAGLSFAMYTAESTETCGGYPASLGYEALDAKTFAGWGVDCEWGGSERMRLGGRHGRGVASEVACARGLKTRSQRNEPVRDALVQGRAQCNEVSTRSHAPCHTLQT